MYGQERFLYRLSLSAYRKNFILKGGLLFLALPVPVRRPTVDIDFAGIAIVNNHEKLKAVFFEIANIPCPDGIEYHANQMAIRTIKAGTDFTGSRIIIPAELARARISLQIDVAFGDALPKRSRTILFPTLLDLPAPSIFAYSLETMIAEKFEAIVSRQTATSRMKDFYDIAYLSESLQFDGGDLRKAFEKAFSRRNADPRQCEIVFKREYADDSHLAALWKGFLARNDLQYSSDFPLVMEKIRRFIEPVAAGTCDNKMWDNKEAVWH
ncbi:MAG: nucleotidyl transferase AbiEii/AbiGii toxin family protein [Chitinivibrionales bacterium]|nr:nucleotidyl transferase AbiEii/AbiGii toxin family protein [Chitinivibrionales bacterium]